MCDACPTIDPDAHLLPEAPESQELPFVSDHFIVWYNDFRSEDRPRVGGKNAGLGEMMGAGLPVPPGFAVTVEGFATIHHHPEVVEQVRGLLSVTDPSDPASLQSSSALIRSAIENTPMSPEVEAAIRDAYHRLGSYCGLEKVPVAVRSSATAEDLPDASFAGQQDTFLWVMGASSVVEHVKRCWSSLFTARAMAYRHQMGYGHETVAMSVGVQQMVDARAAGVAFTLDPATGDRSQIAVDAAWGLGEAVVSGEVTPDHFMIDKVIMEIHHRTISPKQIEMVRAPEGKGVDRREVESDRQTQPCVTDQELLKIARMAKTAEGFFGVPQDVEWAVDRNLPSEHNVVMLQSRPETVWSRRSPQKISAGSGNFMDSIVSTLIKPVHTRSASDGE
ncbi:MAG: hypothetical protein F4Z36_00815 [Acidimicrobiia bacterium]|nr:hypothetical protein [Acidimicrobiia bacterium]